MSENLRNNERYRSGLFGEQLAIEHLQKMGCKLLKQRYRTPTAEIDLIFEDAASKTVIFVEVKRRKECYDYSNVIQPSQWRRIAEASQEFMAEHEEFDDYFVRYDAFIYFTTSKNFVYIDNAYQVDW